MTKKIRPGDALKNLRPGCSYSCTGTNGPDWTVEWHSGNSEAEPSRSEIQAEIDRLQAEYDNNLYQRKRKKEFPTIGDQLDLLYWDKKNGTNKWVEAVDKVKSDNPKP